MKKMILSAVLVLMLSTVSFGKKVIAEGKTFTALGDYKVEATDNPIQLKGEDCKAYIIRYENTPMEVTVIRCKERTCRKYVVLSDKLSVQYVCNRNYLGVERLDKSLEKEGYKTNIADLNRVGYFQQRVLGHGQMSDLEAIRNIAGFFPSLLIIDESMLAEK